MTSPPTQVPISIGALARQTGASVRSIRHYERRGLLSSLRGANGYRRYTGSAVPRVRQIRRLLALGFSLDDIRGFPACVLADDGAPLCPELNAVQRDRLREIEHRIRVLEQTRQRLLLTLGGGSPPPADPAPEDPPRQPRKG